MIIEESLTFRHPIPRNESWFVLADIVKRYNSPNLLSIMVTGGAAGLAGIAAIPGAGKCLFEFNMPYHEFLTKSKYHSVSAEQCEHLAGLIDDYGDLSALHKVVVVAALTTTRYRKGPNHAYVWINGKIWHLALPKPTQEDYEKPGFDIHLWRAAEDEILTLRVAELIRDTLIT